MRRRSLEGSACPVALTLDRVGEWWNMLILRDAIQGTTRFDDFRESLRISPTMLTRRLGGLVESGFLERRLYRERPPRHEYILTDMGRDFAPVLLAMFAFGKRHFQAPDEGIALVEKRSGRFADPVLIDRATGRPITGSDVQFVPASGAHETSIRRLSARPRP